jgi:hypothetical protein
VTGLIASGRNGTAWNGNGIITSQSAAQNSNYTALGIARGYEVKPASVSVTALWAGETITGSDTLVMYTYGGDANLDGQINILDYVRIDQGIAAGSSGWSNGDFNYDGAVNILDYAMVIDPNLITQGAPFSTAERIGGVSAVPEPAIGAAIALLFTLSRRRRHS